MTTVRGTRHSELKQMLEQRRHAILNDVLQEVREASEAASSAHAGDVRDTGDEGEAMLQDALRFSALKRLCDCSRRVFACVKAGLRCAE